METKQRGRPNICRGTKQRKQDFNSKLKAYSPVALDNIITIAENSFDANTRLKANMFLIEKAVGKDYKAIVEETEHNKQTQITLQIINPKQNINVDDIDNEITEELTSIDNDDNAPWGEDIYRP